MQNSEIQNAYIQSVDVTKPVGRMVEYYANQKYWQGFYTGSICSMIGLGLGIFLVDKYCFK